MFFEAFSYSKVYNLKFLLNIEIDDISIDELVDLKTTFNSFLRNQTHFQNIEIRVRFEHTK